MLAANLAKMWKIIGIAFLLSQMEIHAASDQDIGMIRKTKNFKMLRILFSENFWYSVLLYCIIFSIQS